MRISHALLLLPLVATPLLLSACESTPPDNTGVVQVRDILLTHLSATEATKQLQKRIGQGASVSPNLRNNSVIVTGTTAEIARAEELLRQIDVPQQ